MVDEPLHGHEEELRECEKVSALWLCSKKKNRPFFQDLISIRGISRRGGERFLTLR